MMPLKDETGTVQGFLKILRDRTDQRRAIEAQRANAEFLHSVLASSGDCIKVLDLECEAPVHERGRSARHGSERLQRNPGLPLAGLLAG